MPASTPSSSSNRVSVAKALAIERVEADGDAVQPGGAQRRAPAREQHAVGRQREIADRRPRGERLDQDREVAPQQRLAASEPHAVDAERRERVGDGADFLEREQASRAAARRSPAPACSTGSAGCSDR